MKWEEVNKGKRKVGRWGGGRGEKEKKRERERGEKERAREREKHMNSTEYLRKHEGCGMWVRKLTREESIGSPLGCLEVSLQLRVFAAQGNCRRGGGGGRQGNGGLHLGGGQKAARPASLVETGGQNGVDGAQRGRVGSCRHDLPCRRRTNDINLAHMYARTRYAYIYCRSL